MAFASSHHEADDLFMRHRSMSEKLHVRRERSDLKAMQTALASTRRRNACNMDEVVS